MNQKQMEYFVTVYQTQNINNAAKQLYVTRQGVSKMIRLLEEELGQALFLRSAKGVTPTDYATALFPHAKDFLSACTAINGLHTLASQSRSVVTVYALDHILAYLGSSFVTEFYRLHPDIILNVVDTTDDMALAALSAQKCNYAIVTGPIDETRFQGEQLFFTEYRMRMSKNHPLAHKKELTLSDIDGQTIISKGRSYACYRQNMDFYILNRKRKVKIIAETSDTGIICDLLLNNEVINLDYDYTDKLYSHPNIISRQLDFAGESGKMIYLVSNLQMRPTKVLLSFHDFLLSFLHNNCRQQSE